MFRVISIILLLAVSLSAQQAEQPQDNVLRIRSLGGLNTISGDFVVPQNMFRIAQNVDWDRNVGSATERFGYDSVTTIVGQDSLVGLYGAYYSDGSQQLFVVSDSATVGYGNVYKTLKGNSQFDFIFRWCITYTVANNFTYLDSFVLKDADPVWDTVVTSFTSDASATDVEVYRGIKEAIITKVELQNKISVTPNNLCTTGDFIEFQEVLGNTNIVLMVTGTNQTFVFDTSGINRIATYFSIADKPYFTMFNDNVVITTPSGRGIIWDGKSSRNFPTVPPGQPLIVPIYDTGYGGSFIDGEVVYSFDVVSYYTSGTAQLHKQGIISEPITVRNGRVLLTNFSYVQPDSIATTIDSIQIIVRRGTDLGNADDRDYFQMIDTLNGNAATINTIVLIDSLPNPRADSIKALDFDYHGYDSTGVITRRYGAVSFVSAFDSTYSDTTDTAQVRAAGVFHGIPEQTETLGVFYAVSFIDTSLGIESELGMPSAFWVLTANRAGANKPYGYRVSLPLVQASDSGLYRNLYRAHILQITRDSVFNVNDSIKQAQSQASTLEEILKSYKLSKFPFVNRLIVDTVVRGTEWRLVAQIHPDSANYTDSARWDDLQLTARIYNFRFPPLALANTFSFDGRLWGSNKSTAFYSRFDSVAAWGLFDRQILGNNDGQEITLMYPSRGVIVAKKYNSSYNIFKSVVTGTWDSRELSSVFGCIASRSYAKGGKGHYYLSQQGVIRENDGQFLERTQVIENISLSLDNFDKLSLVDKSKSEGLYFDDKYALSIGDTLYVYHEKSENWSTWNLPIGGWTLYGSESERSFLPGDTMFFFKPGDSTIFRYKTAETDGGSFIVMNLETVPLFVDEYYYSINAINFFVNGTSVSDLLAVLLVDPKGTFVNNIVSSGSGLTLNVDSLSERYRRSSLFPVPQLWFSFRISTSASAGNVIIHGFDIEYTRRAKERLR